MNPNRMFRTGRQAALAVAALALPLAASATVDFLQEDHTAVPVYRSYVLGGLSATGDFQFADHQFDSVDYLSNSVPRMVSSVSNTFSEGASSVDITAWSAYSGQYASRNYASMTVHNANPAHVYYAVAGHGTTTSLEFFTPEAAATSARFTWRVDGVQTSNNPSGAGRFESRLDFYATTTPGGSWFDLFSGAWPDAHTVFGPGTYTFTLPVAQLGTPIYLYYWSSAFTEIQPGQATAGSSFTMTADFAHTVVLEQVELLDSFDQPLQDFSVVDAASGENLFNAVDGRVTPLLPAPAVPEPQSALLLALGLAGLLAQRSRSRRRG